MRRQVKPFVTEYRGSPRRTKDLPTSDVQQEAQPSRSRSFADAQKAFQSEGPEDSYEAALRAADALFASSPRPVEAPKPDIAVIPPAPTQSGIDAVFETSLPPKDETFGGEHPDIAPPRRILQAIEPEPVDRFAALEAERAPKRRGRKPGSKNKPKIVVGDDWAAAGAAKPAAHVASAAGTAAAVPMNRPARPSFDVASFARIADDEPVVVYDETVDEGDHALRPRSRNDKFNWKRDGLRPGERWKRRLPKSAR